MKRKKNNHLNDLRKNPHVKKIFLGRVPDIADLPVLKKAMKESLNEKKEELHEAKKTLLAENLYSISIPGEYIDQLPSEVPSYMDDIE